MPAAAPPPPSVVIPNWNGREWLAGCLDSLAGQTLAPLEVLLVDNGSTDGSRALARNRDPDLRIVELGCNTGFAHAANEGLRAARSEFVALINADVRLDRDWVARMAGALSSDPGAASVACKMLDLAQESVIYDAGDVLRRDGACEQRGRFCSDDGSWDQPGEVFGACAGAALYRREAVLAVGGFDERYFAYLEDVDLAVALRVAGWRCRYEPAVARHAGESSSHQLPGGHRRLVARNTLVLIAKWFPARWLPLVLYRQAAWLWRAWREGYLLDQLVGLAAGVGVAAAVLWSRVRESPRRRREDSRAAAPISTVVPRQPIRGPGALGHRSRHAPNVRAARQPRSSGEDQGRDR